MTTLEDALRKFPPSVPSRCGYRVACIDPACPTCPTIVGPPCSGQSSVRFQLTYTCDRSTYSPCYTPVVPTCPPPVKKVSRVPSCRLEWFDCCGNRMGCSKKKMSCHAGRVLVKRPSTLPPDCFHCRPPPFCCPKDGCPPPEPCVPRKCCCPPPCPPLVCRARPVSPPPPPTLCIAAPCPERPGPVPHRCSPMKITPPQSAVRFCIRYTCEGSTYCPCYSADKPRCPRPACRLF